MGGKKLHPHISRVNERTHGTNLSMSTNVTRPSSEQYRASNTNNTSVCVCVVCWVLCVVSVSARSATISPVPLSRHRSQCHAYVFAVQMASIFPTNCFPPLLLQIWQITPVCLYVCVCVFDVGFPYLAIRLFALSSHELWTLFRETVI